MKNKLPPETESAVRVLEYLILDHERYRADTVRDVLRALWNGEPDAAVLEANTVSEIDLEIERLQTCLESVVRLGAVEYVKQINGGHNR